MPSQSSCFFLLRRPQEKQVNFYEKSVTGSNNLLIKGFSNKTQEIKVDFKGSIEINMLTNIDFNFSFSKPNSSKPIEKNEYFDIIERAVSSIKAGTFQKAILSRTKILPFDSKKTLNFYQKLCSSYPNAFVYLLQLPSNECWIGASPELLLSVKDRHLKTTSLAGSKKNDSEKWTEKEFEEQQIVTDYILKILKKYATKITTKGPRTIQTGVIQHLKTEISANLIGEISFRELLEEINPTPAVCGLPKEEARQFILDNEPQERELYTGFIGLKNENEMEAFVNLRCARIFNDSIRLHIGGGITSKSVAEDEWNETETKAQTLIKQLNAI